MIFIYILTSWLIADFLGGFVHWLEDTYIDDCEFESGFLFDIAKENDLHHRQPTAMLKNSGFVNIKGQLIFGLPLSVVLFYFNFPVWLALVPLFASFGNLIHRWAHKPKRQLWWWIRMMQFTGLFISHKHHEAHHRSMKKLIPKHLARKKFCPMTNWINPLLDLIKFWCFLEFLFSKIGIQTTRSRFGED